MASGARNSDILGSLPVKGARGIEISKNAIARATEQQQNIRRINAVMANAARALLDMTLVMNSHPEGLCLGPQVATVEY